MNPEDKQRKVVGVYDRPASADRRRSPWIWILLALLVAAAWVAWFAFRR